MDGAVPWRAAAPPSQPQPPHGVYRDEEQGDSDTTSLLVRRQSL
jgi:hypothetical protein